MKQILFRENFNNVISSSCSRVITCSLKEGNNKYEFNVIVCANDYILDYNGINTLIPFNKLMDSPIGKAIKSGNLYVE